MIELIPYVEINGARTVSDDVLEKIFYKIKEDGTLYTVFADRKVNAPRDFMATMKSSSNLVVFVVVDKKIQGFAWLNGCSDNHAFAHFCFFKESWGNSTESMGKELLRYWMSFPGEKGYLFDVIIGMIPEFNTRAQKFIEKLGFVRVGTIPKMARNGDDRVSSIISYFQRA